MRPSRVLQRVLGIPAREGGISLAWAASGAALALGVGAVLLVFVLSAGSAHPASIDPAHQPAITEGPTNRVALRDGWILARDPTNQGFRRGYPRGTFSGTPVAVPHVANATPVTGNPGIKSYAGSIAWYRTSLTAPSTGLYALRFESVNHRADVWLDGKHLGSPHLGTYLPFEYHFQTTAGPHTLVVRADYRDPNAQSAAGYHRTWFNFGGINGEVTLRPLNQSDLVNPTLQTTLAPASDGSVSALEAVTVEVHNYGPTRTITPSGSLSNGGGSVNLDFGPVTVATGKAAIAHAQLTLGSPALWSPESPNLYDLDLKVGSESEYKARVGVREISRSGNGEQLLLNGAPLSLRGASIQEDILNHGDALTPADQDTIVKELKDLGANATRSQHPLDVGLLERLDAAGILVWQGIGPVDSPGNWSSNTPTLERRAERRARITIRQAQTHPSIIAWNLANEVGGNGHPGGQATYVERMADWIHTNDAGRLVALDIWGTHPPQVAGPMYANIDAIGETDYLGWYESPLVSQTELARLIRQRVDSLHQTLPSKVLIVSEFGGEANYLNPNPAPGSYDFQSRLLATHISTYRSLPYLSGMLVWDLRDFAVAPTFAGGSIRHVIAHISLVHGLNQKGLISYEGVKKGSYSVVQQAFASLAVAGKANADLAVHG